MAGALHRVLLTRGESASPLVVVVPVTFGGCPVTLAIPAGLGPGGTIPVYFEVLSYAGTLTLTATADPDCFRELSALAGALRAELDLIIQCFR